MTHRPGSSDCEVAVIGAGPYGLAVGAHLKAAGVETRVFGDAMSFWRKNMPKGMYLRSPRRATSISDPNRALTLDAYSGCRVAPAEEQVPVETFVDYGLWFQSRSAPDLDRRVVARVAASPRGFVLTLLDGEAISARRVVMATGLEKQHVIPAAFERLPAELASHTVAHADLTVFRGKHVAVVGRGQSAIESAVLLHEAGAEVETISRGAIRWLGGAHAAGRRRAIRGWVGEALAAPSAVGPFPLNWIAETPGLIHRAPQAARARFNERCLRAAAAGWLRPRFLGVKENSGGAIVAATVEGDRVALQLNNGRVVFDHVLLATGYAIDIAKPGILAPDLLDAVVRREGSPILSTGFESSVPGLHFVGASAVASFGPLMRFIAGSGFAARSVTRVVARTQVAARRPRRQNAQDDAQDDAFAGKSQATI
ncbi:MAG TPA: NAD(P)-binding domain-containing protein [Beijerinckiaceae bacterium]|nr:NAD(P)-binding domain-containing protein [Beijerinckiaceae bacterium]